MTINISTTIDESQVFFVQDFGGGRVSGTNPALEE